VENDIVQYKDTVECPHLILCQEVTGESTGILQNWSQTRQFQSTRSPCQSDIHLP